MKKQQRTLLLFLLSEGEKRMNQNKFTEKGHVYAKARPSYPQDLFTYLKEQRILTPNSTIADIGSGTGIFTSQIAPFARIVYAVEPNDDMRLQAVTAFQAYPNIVSINGSAESTALHDHSVDCITVAQAFHWFDRAAFRVECQRILRDNGKIVLVWNDRDASAEIIQDNYRVNAMFCPQFKGSSAGISFAPESFDDFFGSRCECITFLNRYRYDLSTFLNRNISSSYAPRKTDQIYEAYMQALTTVFNTYNNNGYVDYPYITRCYIGEL